MEIEDYDLALQEIEQLGDSFIKSKKIRMELTLEAKEMAWISKLLYEEIDLGTIEAKFNIKRSKHSLECIIDLFYVVLEHVDDPHEMIIAAGFGARSINRLRLRLLDYVGQNRKKQKKQKKKKQKKQ